MPPLRVLIADDHQLFAETLGLTFTASPSSEDVHRACSAGAAAYLNKGCALEHVVSALLGAGPCVLPPLADTESEAAQPHQVAQP